MNRDTDIDTYFRQYAACTGSIYGIRRARNALVRWEIYTMDQLCGLSSDDLAKVWNLGGKSIELVLKIRERYLAEQRHPSETAYS